MTAPYDKSGYMPLITTAFEALSVSSTAVGFTAATADRAMSAHVSVEGGQVRYRIDGTDPTASVGTLLGDGDELVVWGKADIDAIAFIATAGTVTLNTHYAR